MKNKFFVAIKTAAVSVSALMIVMVSCKSGNGEDVDNNAADTLEKVIPLEDLFLPDTAYASVQKVVYEVEKTDTLPHFLKDVDDRYASDI